MARSFDISKKLVWQAYLRVKANKGAGGIDGQTLCVNLSSDTTRSS